MLARAVRSFLATGSLSLFGRLLQCVHFCIFLNFSTDSCIFGRGVEYICAIMGSMRSEEGALSTVSHRLALLFVQEPPQNPSLGLCGNASHAFECIRLAERTLRALRITITLVVCVR